MSNANTIARSAELSMLIQSDGANYRQVSVRLIALGIIAGFFLLNQPIACSLLCYILFDLLNLHIIESFFFSVHNLR